MKVLVGLCKIPPSFKRYVMEPNVFMGYHVRGIASVLSSFGHEQYPSKSDVGIRCLITIYPNESIGFLVGFGRATQYPPRVKRYVMEPNVFMGYLEWGIVGVLNSVRHEQYPSDSIYQNNLTHGVYNITQ
jgi:hypothetical protein